MKEKMDLVAKTFQGLEDVLAGELVNIGAEDVEPGRRMVAFRGDKTIMYNTKNWKQYYHTKYYLTQHIIFASNHI